MEQIGIRHMSSKCETLTDFTKIPKYYGFRGEALANLIAISKSLTIHTQPKNGNKSYFKKFKEGSTTGVTESPLQRPNQGTTVVIQGFLYNLPVRLAQENKDLNLIQIRKKINMISLVNPNITFTLKKSNDAKAWMVLKNCEKVLPAMERLYGSAVANLKCVEFEKAPFQVMGYVGVNQAQTKIQLIFVNRRFIYTSRLHKFIQDEIFAKGRGFKKELIYLINIQCPNSVFKCKMSSSGMKVTFKNWRKVCRCLYLALTKLNLEGMDEGGGKVMDMNTKILESNAMFLKTMAGFVNGKIKNKEEKMKKKEQNKEVSGCTTVGL